MKNLTEVYLLKKQILSMMMAALVSLTCLTPAFAAESLASGTVSDKLGVSEQFLYGTEQSGSLVSRVDKMEKDLYGQTSSGSVMSRVDRVYNRLEGTPSGTQLSIAAQMNAIEWQFADRMSDEGVKTRIGNLETDLFGTQYTQDTILSRLSRLTKSAFPSGSLSRQTVTLPKDSLIKIKFMEDINSKTAQAGDKVDFIADDNVYVGEALVLPKGARGNATIKKVVQPRIFGRDARIDIDFSSVTAVNGEKIPVTVGELAKQQDLFGTQYTQDTILSRLSRLTKSAFPSGSLSRQTVTLPKDSLIKIKFMEDINSKTAQAGDKVDFIADDNVYVGEALVLPKGARGNATIKKVVQPRIFGRDARIDIDFSSVTAVNGEKIPVTVGELAKQQAKTVAGAAGASIGGMVLFGPVGLVGGAFVKGAQVTIPAGSNTYVQVLEDTTVQGIVLQGASTAGVQAVPASEEEREDKLDTVDKPAVSEKKTDKADDKKAVEKEGDDKADAETEKTLAADEKKDADVKDADKKANSHNDEDAEYDEDEDVDLDLAEE